MRAGTVCFPYVLQALAAVGAGNEGCVPYEGVRLRVVRFPFRDALLCDYPLQPPPVSDPCPFELFHVDDEVCAEQQLMVLVLGLAIPFR